jgi:hypothetical protein
MNRVKHLTLAAAAALVIGAGAAPPAGAAQEGKYVVRQGCGADAAAIVGVVNAFRDDLGTNNGNGGTFQGGRREIAWDGADDSRAAPNNLPRDFFNVNAPRGAVFGPAGTLFQQSADASNPTNTPIEFGNLNPTYPGEFSTFSPPRLFAPLETNVTEVSFFIPGTTTPAVVAGFGAVFTDVERQGQTTITYYDERGKPVAELPVPTGPNAGLCFLGAHSFEKAKLGISRVRITTGTTALGPDESGKLDVVAMDDFIYGEPRTNTAED